MCDGIPLYRIDIALNDMQSLALKGSACCIDPPVIPSRFPLAVSKVKRFPL